MRAPAPRPGALTIDLAEDAAYFEGYRARPPIDSPVPSWLSHQVGHVVQEPRQIRAGRGKFLTLTVDLFHLKGFGRSYDEALKMAKGERKP